MERIIGWTLCIVVLVILLNFLTPILHRQVTLGVVVPTQQGQLEQTMATRSFWDLFAAVFSKSL